MHFTKLPYRTETSFLSDISSYQSGNCSKFPAPAPDSDSDQGYRTYCANQVQTNIYAHMTLIAYTAILLLLLLSCLPVSGYAQKLNKAQTTGQQHVSDSRKMRSMLIIDGSGSMWGSIERKNKIVVVRELLPKILAPYAERMTLGIMSYGHRRKGLCSDVQLLVPPSKYSKKTHGNVLKRLRARGKTPISLALEQAVTHFPKGSQNNHAILLADGFENCRRDPCITSNILKQKMPGLKIHVIAYGFRSGNRRAKEDLSSLSCIANNTGGRFFTAYKKQELKQALTTLITGLWQQEKTINDRILVENQMKPGLYLTASMKKNGQALKKNLVWAIYKGHQEGTSDRPVQIAEARENITYFPDLPQGDYYVEARYQGIRAGKTVRINTRRVQELNISLRAANISLGTYTVLGGPLVARVFYEIFSIDPEHGNEKTFLQLSSHTDRLILPAGQYRFVTRIRNIEMDQKINLKPGDDLPVSFYVNGGRIELTTFLQSGTPSLNQVTYSVLRKTDNPDRPYASFLKTLAPTPVLELPSDQYLLDIKAGLANKTLPINVDAGKNARIAVNLNAGRLTLKQQKQGTAPASKQISGFRIYSENKQERTNPESIFQTSKPSLSLILPLGSYKVESFTGASKIVRYISLNRENHDRTLIISHSTDDIRLELQNMQGRKLVRNVYWKVTDQQGGIVFRSSLATPALRLEKGQYNIQAFYKNRTYSKEVIINGGKFHTVALTMK